MIFATARMNASTETRLRPAESATRRETALTITEAHVQQTVREFLELDGWRAIRTDPVSDRTRGKGFGEVGMPDCLFLRYLHYCQGPGCSGVNCIPSHEVKAQVMWIEFKRPGQKPKPHQTRWIEAERARNALVLVVDDIDAFIAWYKASGLNTRMQ